MIKTKQGNLRIKGDLTEVMADVSVIVNKLCHEILPKTMTQEDAKEIIMQAVKRGMMSKEELDEEVKRKIGELLERVANEMKGQGEE